MKEAMNTFDLRAEVAELTRLEGAKVNKVYQPDPEAVSLNMWLPGSGRQDLHVDVGRAVFLTSFKRDNPREPPDFAMQLRKQIGGGTVEEVRQIGFDRLLALEIDTHLGPRSLIFELFGDGNVVLAEPAGILGALRYQEFRHRTIRPGVEYVPPPMRGDPFVLEADEVAERLAASERDLVRCAAVELDLSAYADEVVHRTGLDPEGPAPDADPDVVHEAIQATLEPFRDGRYEPRIFRDDDGTAVDVAPVPLEHLQARGLDVEPYDTMNEALDVYFSREHRRRTRTRAETARKETLEKLETRIRHQRDGIERLQDEAERERTTAEAIYQNYQLLEQVLDAFSGLRGVALEDAHDADGTPDAVRDLRIDERVAVVAIRTADGDEIEADIRLDASVEENASWHYDLADKAEAKAGRAEEALQESLEERERVETGEVEVEPLERRETERTFWFEDYRWCLASTGHVMVGGQDASSNDRVVSKYLEDHDRYAHADLHGAPSVVVKSRDGEPPPDEALDQAIQFACCYSKAWRSGMASAEGYWVRPEQVSKSPESGEHLPTGAFIIRGTRHHATAPIRLAIGPTEIEGVPKIMGGPVASVRARTDRYVVLEPGTTDTGEIASTIADAFDVDIEPVQKALPPGPCKVVETQGVSL